MGSLIFSCLQCKSIVDYSCMCDGQRSITDYVGHETVAEAKRHVQIRREVADMTATAEKNSHTPGPWEYRADRTIAANGVPLARCYAGRNEAANGSLFAAAPDLLAAANAAEKLIGLMPAGSPGQAVWEQLRAALAKASRK